MNLVKAANQVFPLSLGTCDNDTATDKFISYLLQHGKLCAPCYSKDTPASPNFLTQSYVRYTNDNFKLISALVTRTEKTFRTRIHLFITFINAFLTAGYIIGLKVLGDSYKQLVFKKKTQQCEP